MYLCFWSHTPGQSGVLDASCLSQWFPRTFELDGTQYRTVEHYMMAAKAGLFGDTAVRERILACDSPAEARRLGRSVAGFDEGRWIAERFGIVLRGNLAKFSQHEDLRAFLLGTGEQVLVEAIPLDPIWGVGLAPADPAARDPRQWRGDNLLGFALMQVRAELR